MKRFKNWICQNCQPAEPRQGMMTAGPLIDEGQTRAPSDLHLRPPWLGTFYFLALNKNLSVGNAIISK